MHAEIVSTETPFKGHFRIDRFFLKVEQFGGGMSETMSREVFRVGRAVAVLLYDPHAEKFVLVEQFRIAPYLHQREAWLLECVAGMVEPDEEREHVAHREAAEESGCAIQRLEFACEYLVSPGTSDELLALYVGEVESSKAGGIFGLKDEHENIRVHVMPVAEAMKLLDEGKLLNVTIVMALLWFSRNGAALKQTWLKG
jgi:ADP-ribose pyrophosphatase